MESDRAFIVEHLVPLSLSTLTVGILVTAIGLSEGITGFWLMFFGVIGLLIGLLWFINYLRHIRKFSKLMAEGSKTTFQSKLPDIEFLTERMPMKYEIEFRNKKKEFGIK